VVLEISFLILIMTFNWLLTFLQNQDMCLKYSHLKKHRFFCRQFLLGRAKLTSSFPPPLYWQVWERHGMAPPWVVAGQYAIHTCLSKTPDWGRPQRFLARQHHLDSQSHQFVHLRHVSHGRGLSTKLTVYHWCRSEPSSTLKSPVS